MATLDADDLAAIALIVGSTDYTSASGATLAVTLDYQTLRAGKIEQTATDPAVLLTSGSMSLQAELLRSLGSDAVRLAGGNHAIAAQSLVGTYGVCVAPSASGVGSVSIAAQDIIAFVDSGFGKIASPVFRSLSGAPAGGSRVIVRAEQIQGVDLFDLDAASRWDISADVIACPVTMDQANSVAIIRGARITGAIAVSAGSLTLIDCICESNVTQSGTGVIRLNGTQVLGTETGTISVVDFIDGKLTTARLAKIDSIGTSSFLPVTGTVQARVNASQITVYTSEVATVTLGLEDTNGTPVDTTGMTLELVFESGTTDVTISNASITKATNGISFAITSDLNSSERDWNYALRKSDETVLQTGVLSVQYAPNN